MAKILKTLRLEEELINNIERYGKGNNFTVKVEYILTDYLNTEKERKERLNKINNEIEEKERILNNYSKKIDRMKKVLDATLNILKYIEGQNIMWSINEEVNIIKDCIKRSK